MRASQRRHAWRKIEFSRLNWSWWWITVFENTHTSSLFLSFSVAFNWIRAYHFLQPLLHNLTSAWFNMRNFHKCSKNAIYRCKWTIWTFLTSWRACDARIFNNDWHKSIIEFQFWGKTGPFTRDIVRNKRFTVHLTVEKITYFQVMIEYFSPIFAWFPRKCIAVTLIKYGFWRQKRRRQYTSTCKVSTEIGLFWLTIS